MIQPLTARKSGDRPRVKPAEERREDLMNAAERLFLEQGVAPTTIEQITSGAGVAKGSFYLQFASKDDVLTALRERFIRDFVSRTERAIGSRPVDDWKERLAIWAKETVEGYLDTLPIHDIVFHEVPPHSWYDAHTELVIAHLSAILEGGERAGAWAIGDARFTAVFLFSGLHEIVDSLRASGRPIDRARLAEQIRAICFKTIGVA